MEYPIRRMPQVVTIEGLHIINYFEFGKNFSHMPEQHDFWEMVYVDSGEINAVSDGMGIALTQGQVIFHRPGEIHSHVSNNLVANSILVVAFSSSSEAMRFFDRKIFTLGKTEKTLLSLFVSASREALGDLLSDYTKRNKLDFSGADDTVCQLLWCYLTELLLVLMRSGEEGGTRTARSEDAREIAYSSTVQLILDYLAASVRENVTLETLCTKFFMGKSKLCKMFDDYVGSGPIEYFSRLKMAEAKRLLREGELSVGGVADELGYSSIHNFSRAFKKAFGLSPTAYQKKINLQG